MSSMIGLKLIYDAQETVKTVAVDIFRNDSVAGMSKVSVDWLNVVVVR